VSYKLIVVIDDSRSMLGFVKDIIEKEGHKVILFQCPLEALRIIPSLLPDLIICDYMMFDMDGIETIKQLRFLGVKIPMMLYSALDDHDTIQLCKLHNIPFISKPINRETLHKLVDDLPERN
jgi:DNA-binding response OmpR family regulator